MSITAAPRVNLRTPEDLLRTPRGKHCELINGQFVEKSMGAESDWIGVQVSRLLSAFVESRKLGFVFGPTTGYQCFPDDHRKVRKPGVSFVAAERLPSGTIPKGHVKAAPNLAVEVISPGDSYAAVEGKIEDYLRAGIPLIWVLMPESRTVKVYVDGDTRPLLLREADELTGGRVLPGFACPIGALFPPRDATAGG